MRNKVAKRLRNLSQYETVGKTETVTRSLYRKYKAIYKSGKFKSENVIADELLPLKTKLVK